jgi:hypothetical protein
MDGIAIIVLIIGGLAIISGFFSGKPTGEYLVGMAVGWALIHTYYLYQRKKTESDYPIDWFQIRRIVLKRDNYKCCNCDTTKNLHVHHIVPIKRGGSNKETNLITLCEKCHILLHPHMR